jgi:hypothetical protein
VAANPLHLDPDIGIPELVRRLSDDGKRLLTDEVRLAKLELTGNARQAARGGVRLAIAFGIGVVALTAATLLLATFIGRLVNGHMWVGAVVTGLLELGIAAVLLRRGVRAYAAPSYTLSDTRESIGALRGG